MSESRRKSDTARAFSEDGALKTHVGGQALIEGIMMRGKYSWAVAVRDPYGDIYLEEHELGGAKKSGIRNKPFIRGCFAFVESLVLGFKALSVAAEHAFIEDDEGNVYSYSPDGSELPPRADDASKQAAIGEVSSFATTTISSTEAAEACPELDPEVDVFVAPLPEGKAAYEGEPVKAEKASAALGGKEMTISLVLGLVLGIVLFIVAPAFVTNLIVGDYDGRTLLWNIVDGILRIAIFIFYIWLIGRMSDIKRMFGYHGAEHKAIHCFEHGLPMTPENARSFPRLHVRCGTAFLIMVMILAIFIYTVVPLDALIEALGITNSVAKLALVIVVRILLLPIIAGIAYEITVKWAGTHPNNPVVKVVLWPGLQMQRLTTREPDDGQIECAIASMQLVLDYEQRVERG